MINIWVDPEAAAIVLGCGRPITLVPLEVTHRALATDEVMQRLRAVQRPVPNFVADLLIFFAETYRTVFDFTAPPVHDPCAVAAVIDATLMPGDLIRVEVELNGTWSTGRTVCDIHGKLELPPNVHVSHDLDVARFWDLVIETLLSYD